MEADFEKLEGLARAVMQHQEKIEIPGWESYYSMSRLAGDGLPEDEPIVHYINACGPETVLDLIVEIRRLTQQIRSIGSLVRRMDGTTKALLIDIVHSR